MFIKTAEKHTRYMCWLNRFRICIGFCMQKSQYVHFPNTCCAVPLCNRLVIPRKYSATLYQLDVHQVVAELRKPAKSTPYGFYETFIDMITFYCDKTKFQGTTIPGMASTIIKLHGLNMPTEKATSKRGTPSLCVFFCHLSSLCCLPGWPTVLRRRGVFL